MDGKTTIKYLQTYIYDVDIEQVIKIKSEMNESRYPSEIKFEEGR